MAKSKVARSKDEVLVRKDETSTRYWIFIVIAGIFQAWAAWYRFGYSTNVLDILVIIDTTAMILAAVSFYYYLFYKESRAIEFGRIMVGVSLIAITLIYLLFVSDDTIFGYFGSIVRGIVNALIAGLFVYCLTFAVVWIGVKVKHRIFDRG
jgi:hypothetical protein